MKKKINWRKHGVALLLLLLLQLVIDLLYVYIYPTVNPLRATFIGLTAFVVLWLPGLRRNIGLHPYLAFLPIFVNALLGALAVQGGIVQSKSFSSAVLHGGILVVAYWIIVWIKLRYQK